MRAIRAALAILPLVVPSMGAPPAVADPAEVSETAAADPARPETLEQLMRVMAQTPGVVAAFTETKHIGLLDAPLETKGTLYFIPPDRMARHTTAPSKSSLIIDGQRLSFSDEAGGDDIDLAANPVARVFVDNFIVLFNGDLDELQRRYEPAFSVGSDAWSLKLVPRRAPLNRLIESIEMRGDEHGMRSMTLNEEGGDRTETVFSELDAAHHFTEAEIERAFAAEPAAP